MGFLRIKARIWNVEDLSRATEVELLADTGAIYTVLPSSLLKSLGVKPIGRRRFRLTDNRIVERDIGVIGIQIGDRWSYTPVVFGDEGVYILGAVTLEELGLEVDPVKGVLKPAELLLF
ncbi:conserved hypothetical protein [Ignisphaera aggregans DSM 17230]|uniref:Retroviral aspartyl protease n=1 Tax=Ignisphaera aggregans (strain DSM 17230 / JCM 13409 / AQ1.S1) TaxID=583356 RepID=E0STK7_IGNAA|nr:conserved hypothetical protein [Ignisphaera aggregans DSM 17230]